MLHCILDRDFRGALMNTKRLILIGVVLGLLLLTAVGLLLLTTLGPGSDRPEPEDSSQLIDSGHFVLELNGIPILEESYTLEFHPAALLRSCGV